MKPNKPPQPLSALEALHTPIRSTPQAGSKRAQALSIVRRALAEGRYRDAHEALRPFLKRGKPDAAALYLAGFISESLSDFNTAILQGKKSLSLSEHPETLMLLARCRRALGETDACVHLCDRTPRLLPDYEHARTVKAGALEEAGRFDDAEAVIGPMLADYDVCGQTAPPVVRIEWAKLLVQRKRYPEAVALIDELLQGRLEGDEAEGKHNRRALLYLKAKACDRQKDYAAAYEAARQSNELTQVTYSPEVYEQQLDALMENWSAAAMAKFPVSTCRSPVPVFVAGMPRSGTSLIDQIIDAHPQAAGVGELASIEQFALQLSQAWRPELEPPHSFGAFQSKRWSATANAYVKEIQRQAAPGVQRIVNKALGNNRLVGLIARLFPQTRIILAIRDPRDVAVSCFMGGFNQHTLSWTHRLDHVAHAWGQSRRIMEYWKSTLDVPILEVRYERLVSDPDTEFPRIIEFLGLEWDEACRRFHESRRTVRTLSYDQVNRPLYTSSIARYRHYQRWLDGIDFPEY